MTVGPQGVLDLATVLRLSTDDDLTRTSAECAVEESVMFTQKSKPRPQRPKSGTRTRWPRWLRSPRLLKWTFRIMLVVFRIWGGS